MSRSRICLISGIYPPESGGPAKFSFEFANWLSENSIASTTITLTDGSSVKQHDHKRSLIKITRSSNLLLRYVRTACAIRTYSTRNIPILAAGMFLETYFATRLSCRKYIAKVPGDFVWERARNSGHTKSGIEEFQSERLSLKYRVFRYIASLSLRKATLVIVPTRQLEKLCKKWGVASEKIRYVPNSVDINIFRPRSISTTGGHYLFDIISVCRLVKWKGLEELISVSKNLKFRAVIAGDGPERKSLEEFAQKIGASVSFLGDISQTELINRYQQTRFFVLNSSYEGLSHALLEARASGLFCIARANTGSEDVIQSGSDGILCGSKEYPDLESALKYVSSHPSFESDCVKKSIQNTETYFNRDRNFETIRASLMKLV